MSHISNAPLLRFALRLDALASGGCGVLAFLAAGALAPLLGLPEMLLRVLGALFVPWALVLWWIAARPAIPPAAGWTIAGLNAGWVALSLAVLLEGILAPTALGIAFVVAQAAMVAGFAALQAQGTRLVIAARAR